jgi:TPR repeat protein
VLYDKGKYIGHGSGFFVAKNLVATNYHVIKNHTSGYINFIDGENMYLFNVVIFDKAHDLALLEVNVLRYPLKFADLSLSFIGDDIYAIGTPLDTSLSGIFTRGNISQIKDKKDKDTITRLIIHSAPISAGNSGGPLLNEEGEVIGINSAQFINGQNINLAVSAYYLKKLIDRYSKELPINIYKKLADKGDAKANYTMAMEALKQNRCDIAKKRLELSAKKGYQKAQNRIAILKYSGKCYDKNIANAKDIFIASLKNNPNCSDESLKAGYMLANIIFYNENNYSKALKLYEQVSDGSLSEYDCDIKYNNDIQAYSAYMSAYILEQSYNATSESFIRYKKSAQLGYNKAQYKLGLLYAQGVGTAQDLENARVWLSKSAQNGYQKARDEMQRYGLNY